MDNYKYQLLNRGREEEKEETEVLPPDNDNASPEEEGAEEMRQLMNNLKNGGVLDVLTETANLKNDISELIFNSVEADLGVGIGGGASLNIGGAQFTFLAKWDLLHLHLDNGEFFFGGYGKEEFSLSGPYWNAYRAGKSGPFDYLEHPWETKMEEMRKNDYVAGFGGEAFVGINIEELYYSAKEFLEGYFDMAQEVYGK